ncbi:MAG TPA: hypothetical protein VF337_07975 [Candidatus Limnocylindrales bacterium]
MPLFGKTNRSARDHEPEPQPLLAEVSSHEFSLKLSYSAKSSEGVRLKAGPGLVQRLHSMLAGYVKGESELVEPLPVALGTASPFIARIPGSMQWLQYNHKRSAVTRHALVVLESVDAVDLVYETLVCGLLSGETDPLGYPDYNAIIGGVVSHFDEVTGDLIVRAVVGWGGKGVRGDTDRNAAGVLAGLFNNVAGDTHAIGTVSIDRPTASPGSGGLACQHCGFVSGLERVFYCPKCGMRMLRA